VITRDRVLDMPPRVQSITWRNIAKRTWIWGKILIKGLGFGENISSTFLTGNEATSLSFLYIYFSLRWLSKSLWESIQKILYMIDLICICMWQ